MEGEDGEHHPRRRLPREPREDPRHAYRRSAYRHRYTVNRAFGVSRLLTTAVSDSDLTGPARRMGLLGPGFRSMPAQSGARRHASRTRKAEPPQALHAVPRARLFQRLDEAREHAAIWVAARRAPARRRSSRAT